MIFTIFTNITNFQLLPASVLIVCIELENNCYKSNNLQEYRVHSSKPLHTNLLLLNALLLCSELKNHFHNFYKSNRLKKTKTVFTLPKSHHTLMVFSSVFC